MFKKVKKLRADPKVVELLTHMLEDDPDKRWSARECLKFAKEHFKIDAHQEIKTLVSPHAIPTHMPESTARAQQQQMQQNRMMTRLQKKNAAATPARAVASSSSEIEPNTPPMTVIKKRKPKTTVKASSTATTEEAPRSPTSSKYMLWSPNTEAKMKNQSESMTEAMTKFVQLQKQAIARMRQATEDYERYTAELEKLIHQQSVMSR